MRDARVTILLAVAAFALAAACAHDAGAGDAATATAAAPVYGDAFWSRWGDGRAELAGYDLTYPRYGELRRGTAVSVVVTEEFASGPRVKHEDRSRPAADVFPVVKLNLMQDFATGVYDYNLMTSAFVGLASRPDGPAGSTTKLAFSAQEWCGQAWSQVVFDADAVRHVTHSYFDGEADRDETLPRPAGALAEDSLLLWARGLAAPLLEPGGRREVPLLRSLEIARLRHVDVAWDRAVVERAAEPVEVEVPAGTFAADVLTVTVEPAAAERLYPPSAGEGRLERRVWTFWVERGDARRVLRWTRDDGLDARLLASERLPYWSMNAPGSESALERLGLTPRPPHTP